MANKKKNLYAFDFDQTIIEGNSDVLIIKLMEGPIQEIVGRYFDGNHWTSYMQSIFKYLHTFGVTSSTIEKFLQELTLAPGMSELLQRISMNICEINNNDSHLIVLSDANDYFIKTRLDSLSITPTTIISNKCIYNSDGCLIINPYQIQKNCNICPQNLCKGGVIKGYIAEHGPFDTVYYIGDGRNDLCPVFQLSEKDYAFVRQDYLMDKIIKRGFMSTRNLEDKIKIDIKAKTIFYKEGKTIENEIFQNV